MTLEPPQAEERGRKDPVHEVTLAIDEELRRDSSIGWHGRAAKAALARLGKHGYLSMQYYDWRREQQKDETR
jgi:hypothetical protein